jgi:tetratricopeptide (TPR) repeat protein
MVDTFVGRQRELAILRAGLDDAIKGRGRLFLLSGEPGIGKSRMAEELSREATERGVRVVWGRCWEGGGAPAYWPFIQILRGCAEWSDFAQTVETLGERIAPLAELVSEIVPSVPLPLGRVRSDYSNPEQARFQLFDAVTTLVKNLAISEAMVLVIDDLHDADASSLQMLRFMARGLKDVPVLLVGTHREREVERSPELRSAVAELAREGRPLPLKGLTLTDTADWMRLCVGEVPTDQFLANLYRTTAGNPLFLGGVMQTLLSEGKLDKPAKLTGSDLKLPANVRDAIHARLGVLSRQTRTILSVAAAAGNEFELAPLERATGTRTPDLLHALDEAVALGIILPLPGSADFFRFAHALVRAAIYESVGVAERAHMHQRIGHALEAVYSKEPGAHMAEIAYHFRLALPVGSKEKAIGYSIRACEAAEAVYAYEEAISQGEAALALMKNYGCDPRERAALLDRLGRLEEWTYSEPKLETFETAIASYEELKLPIEAARARVQLGNMLMGPPHRDTSRAMFHFRKAREVLGEAAPNGWLARIYQALGDIASHGCRFREALESYARAMEVSEQAGDDDAWSSSATMFALVQSACYGRIHEGQALLDRVWERLGALHVPGRLWWTILIAGGCHEVLWDFRSAGEWFAKGLASSLPGRAHVTSMRLHLAECCLWLGDLTQMTHHLADWQEFDPSLRGQAAGLLAVAEGDSERLEKMLQAGVASREFEESSHFEQYGLQHMLAATLQRAGNYARAEETIISALAPCESDEMFLYREMMFRPEHALNLIELGNLEGARAEIRRCAEILSSGEDWRGLKGYYHSAAGFCATEAGDMAEGERHFQAAISTFRRLTLPMFEAGTFALWGHALVRGQQPRTAQGKLDAAIEILRRIGAGQAWIDSVLEEKSRASGGMSPAASSNASNECALRREGEYWTVAYGGSTSRLKDARGLHYIAYLLAHPGKEIRASDLAALFGGTAAEDVETTAASDLAHTSTLTGDLGDAGEMLDAQAKASYQRRLKELREELEEARELGSEERAEQAQAEIEALAHELKSAIGLGGRRRRAASSSERARTAITRAIKLALAKINENNPALGKLLSTTIRTGTSCSYVPDDRFPVSWKL